MNVCFCQQKEDISLSEGSTVDLRKPGEEEDEFSEVPEEALDPENCFPDGEFSELSFKFFVVRRCKRPPGRAVLIDMTVIFTSLSLAT